MACSSHETTKTASDNRSNHLLRNQDMTKTLHKDYCESVLRVEIPVVVTLAHKHMQIDQVLRLVPGAMIQFDKPCDSPMTIEVGDQPIATGEIVKTGDKFGIRINDILQPKEQFIPVNGGASSIS